MNDSVEGGWKAGLERIVWNEGSAGGVEAFHYPDGPAGPAGRAPWPGQNHSDSAGALWSGAWADAADSDAGAEQPPSPAEARLRAEFERLAAEQARQAFESGRERGRQEGRTAERAAQAGAASAAAALRARQARELLESWSAERDRYMLAVEHEVVALALAVAARVLRREALMDPLLLTGAVRVALGQLAASTAVRIRVPGAELELWTQAMSLLPNPAHRPAVTADEGMQLGECRLETELGSVDLGLRAQLEEIERGFFDRAAEDRPAEDWRAEDRRAEDRPGGARPAEPRQARRKPAQPIQARPSPAQPWPAEPVAAAGALVTPTELDPGVRADAAPGRAQQGRATEGCAEEVRAW